MLREILKYFSLVFSLEAILYLKSCTYRISHQEGFSETGFLGILKHHTSFLSIFTKPMVK